MQSYFGELDLIDPYKILASVGMLFRRILVNLGIKTDEDMIPEEELKRMREELVRKAEAMRRSGRNVAEKIPGDPASIGLLRMDDDDSGRDKLEFSCPGNMLPASRQQHNALTLEEECAKERLREERKIRDEEGRIRGEEVEMRVREDLIYELIVDYFKRDPRDSVFKSKRFTNIDKIYLIEKL